MSILIIKPKDYEPSTVKLDKVRMTIGRSSRNDICISDPFASRLHAELRREGDTVLLTDMGSANGTILNGQRVTGSIRLAPGSRIRIGETEIEFEDEGPRSVPTVYLSGPEVAALPADTITTTNIGGRATTDLITSLTSGGIGGGPPSRTAAGAARGRLETRVGASPLTSPEVPTVSQQVLPADTGARRDLLGIVSKVGIALLPRTSLEETLKITIDLVFDAIPVERGFLFLKDGDALKCKIARGADQSALPADSQVQISRSITSKVLIDGASILTSDAMHDPRFQSQNSVVLRQIRSVMAVPLFSGEETFGLIYVDNPFDNRFAEEDLNVLSTIASVASIKIEHERLLEQLLEKRRMEEELKVASEIQMRLQPVAPPKIEGWDMTGVSFPSREIGGDYYDFIHRTRDSRLIIALGDVAGKGTGAALLMSSLHAAVRAQSQTRASIAEVMGEINRYIYENTPANKFVTLFYAELDPSSGVLRYSNGGHNQPVLVRRGGQELRLEVGGLPIGIMPNAAYEEGSVSFESGDVLVIYSDGISESVNEQGDEFGEERLVEVVRKNLERSASGIRDRIDEALSRFVGSAAAVDDMTLTIVKRSLR
jgi:serine phosphatase RsbU (regulator of sigma subunit)/pSer/pThr/pTyr-binding forkhead associated (FHA) protein